MLLAKVGLLFFPLTHMLVLLVQVGSPSFLRHLRGITLPFNHRIWRGTPRRWQGWMRRIEGRVLHHHLAPFLTNGVGVTYDVCLDLHGL
jgi:hypothetical protein